MSSFFRRISRGGLILAAIGVFLLVTSVPDTLVSFKEAKNFEDVMMGDVEIAAGDHVEGQVPFLLDTFAIEQTWTENTSNNSVTPKKTSRRFYVMPCGDGFAGLSVGSTSASAANDLVDQTYGYFNGGAAPTAELILDCRVSEMNEELAGMFRDEMRDYYELTDQEIESLGTLLMVEPRSFTTVRIFSGAGAGFVLLGLLLLVLRWRKVSAVERAQQEAL